MSVYGADFVLPHRTYFLTSIGRSANVPAGARGGSNMRVVTEGRLNKHFLCRLFTSGSLLDGHAALVPSQLTGPIGLQSGGVKNVPPPVRHSTRNALLSLITGRPAVVDDEIPSRNLDHKSLGRNRPSEEKGRLSACKSHASVEPLFSRAGRKLVAIGRSRIAPPNSRRGALPL